MKHLKIFEKLNKEYYFEKKKEKEKEIIQDLGNQFIDDIVKDGDFEGLNFLLNTGFDVVNCDSNYNLINWSLINDQMEMFEWLLNINYGDYDNPIDAFSIHEFSEQNEKSRFTQKDVHILKIISDKGYDFNQSKINEITLYLCDHKFINGAVLNIPKKGLLPFFEWLIKKHPETYSLFDEVELPDRTKYKYLERGNKSNLWN